MKKVNLKLELSLSRAPSSAELTDIAGKVEQLLRTKNLYEHYFGKGKLLSVRGHKVTFKVKRKPKKVVHNPCTCGICRMFAS